jgi:hypothetical protein
MGGAGGSRGSAEGHALRANDAGHDKPSPTLQAGYLNDLHLALQLTRNNGQNTTNPEAQAILNNSVFDPDKMLRDADKWLKTPEDGARAGLGVMSAILQGLGDVGKGFCDSQSDQTTPDEYARLDQERQQRRADEEQARLAEQQRQEAA